MEYILGSITTFIILIFLGKNVSKIDNMPKIKYSQSNIHSMIYPLLPKNINHKKKAKSQSKIHFDKINVKVVIRKDRAFWIRDNVLYTALVNENGIDKDSTSVVDTMSMSRVQLDEMMFIVDQLRSDSDNSSTGK